MAGPGPFARRLFRAVLAACHTYVPERELSELHGAELQRRAAILGARAASRYGFIRRRFDLDEAAERLANLSSALPELEHAYSLLADEPSRALLVELFALRVLGADHVRGPVAFDDYRARQRALERETTEPLDRFRVTGPAGTAIRLHGTAEGLASVFSLGQYRYPGVEPRPGDVAIDGGAAWGDTALWLADLVGADGRVVAFEFAPGNLRTLRENLRLNPELAPRITVDERALWDRGGERLPFTEAGQLTAVGGGEQQVTTVTVDELGLDRVDFIKLDVEGAEPRVLAGATDTVRRFRPALAVAAYHDPWHLIELPRWVAGLGLGYRLFLGHAAPGTAETVLFAAPGQGG